MTSRKSVTITSVLGNSQKLDGGSMFGNVPRALWQTWLDVDELHRIDLACRCMLIEFDQRRILCETGIGNFFEPKLADRFGVVERNHVLKDNLATLGIAPDDVDMVILSHLHFDHAGGLLPSYEEMQQGAEGLVFPRAKIVVGKEAWERSQHPHFRDRASFIPELNKRLQASGRLIVVDGPSHPDVDPDVFSFRYSSGHTPGQMHTLVHGGEGVMMFAGDLIPGTSWVHLPVTMGYDRHAELVIDEKEKLYEDVVKDRWWLFYTHDHRTAASRVAKNEKGKFVPVEQQEVLSKFSL